MSGITALQRIIFAPESTAGTAPANNYETWRGMGQLKDNQTTNIIQDRVGVAIPSIRSYVPRTGSSLSMESVPANYEQIQHILNAGIAASTPVTDVPTLGTGISRTWNLGIAVPNTLRTYSIITGDNQRLNRMSYAFVESFSLSATSDDALMVDASWIGRKPEKGVTLPVTVVTPDVETMLPCSGATLYIDDGGAIGSGDWGDIDAGRTQVSNLVHDWTLTVTTGYTPIYYTDDGRCDFGKIVFSAEAFSAELSLTFEHNTTANTEETHWNNSEPRLYRLSLQGSALDTAGSLVTNKRFIIDLAGVYTDFSELGDMDGNSTVSVTLQVGYEPTSQESMRFVLINETS